MLVPSADISNWFQRLGISHRGLAREAGVSTAFICDVVHGRRRASPRVLTALERLERRIAGRERAATAL